MRSLTLLEQATQLTHTPSYREKYTKSQPFLHFCLEQNSLVTYHTRYYQASTSCLGCQHFDFNSADWFSIVSTWAPADTYNNGK